MPAIKVNAEEEWVLGPEGLPFYTKRWTPAEGDIRAHAVFVHGFAEHIQRYDHFFRKLAAAPHNISVMAFDQRGWGRTAQKPLTAESPQVVQWKKEGETVVLSKGDRGRNGGWEKAIPDIEFFVRREAARAGGKVFLWGHSMGGGEVLGFVTRQTPQTPKDALALLSGVIASGPFIKQARPSFSTAIQVKLGSLVNSFGGGSLVIPTPLDANDLSHDPACIEDNKKDPFCTPAGSIKATISMIEGGNFLDTHEAWNAWPKNLPLFLYHGGEDHICCPKATVRFGDRVVAEDKKTKLIEGMYHEVHNELEPEPTRLADMVAEWILKRSPGGEGATPKPPNVPLAPLAAATPTATATAPAPSVPVAAPAAAGDKAETAKL